MNTKKLGIDRGPCLTKDCQEAAMTYLYEHTTEDTLEAFLAGYAAGHAAGQKNQFAKNTKQKMLLVGVLLTIQAAIELFR